VDVATASHGRFGEDPQSVYDTWDDFVAWAGPALASLTRLGAAPYEPLALGAPLQP
jgi:hypothetical protein